MNPYRGRDRVARGRVMAGRRRALRAARWRSVPRALCCAFAWRQFCPSRLGASASSKMASISAEAPSRATSHQSLLDRRLRAPRAPRRRTLPRSAAAAAVCAIP